MKNFCIRQCRKQEHMCLHALLPFSTYLLRVRGLVRRRRYISWVDESQERASSSNSFEASGMHFTQTTPFKNTLTRRTNWRKTKWTFRRKGSLQIMIWSQRGKGPNISLLWQGAKCLECNSHEIVGSFVDMEQCWSRIESSQNRNYSHYSAKMDKENRLPIGG